MKILIGCDERSSVVKYFYDLKRAGFPEFAEVCILSVADVFVVPGYKKTTSPRSPDEAYFTHIDQEIEKAQGLADNLMYELQGCFPHWHFSAESSGGSPAFEILNKAEEWKADLIVVGSHERSGMGEFFFGSTALKVLSESHCSVRIVRSEAGEMDSPSRIVVAVDGSLQSDVMIQHLANRQWKKGSVVHLITAINSVIYTTFLADTFRVPVVSVETTPQAPAIREAWISKGNKEISHWIKNMHAEYRSQLEKTGLTVSSFIKEGDPKVVLLEETQQWGADCIYVGALGYSRLERFLMGSVSSAIAVRAHCSVEVVRDGVINTDGKIR